jgi:hypothetical protein
MKRALTLATLLFLLSGVPYAHAVLIFYPDRTAFNTANPGLPIEGFENANTGTTSFTGPLNSTSDNPSHSRLATSYPALRSWTILVRMGVACS